MKFQVHDVESVTEVIDHHHQENMPFVTRKLIITDKDKNRIEVLLFGAHTYQLLTNDMKVNHHDT
jgi:hypothetical protein